ncbi:MAG: NAD(P)H-dependent flavin oxidoreductase [Promethearchaeia archaeon]
MKWKTKITQMTKIKYPIIMGAFAGIGRAEFAAAFSNGGGLGIITALNFRNNDEFKKEVEKMNSLTDKPWGVNFSVMPPMLIEKMGGKGRDEDSYLDFVEIAIDAGVKIFTTSAYRAPKIGQRIHEVGGYWFHKVATLKHAVSAEKQGVDAVTIVGIEGTGFKSPQQNTTLVNITMARRLLKIPVIAAGGIGDARGFLGALAMGAEAVCFGSAIIPTKESPASEEWKQKVLNLDILDENFHDKIFKFESKDTTIASMAAGHCDKILTLQEFIEEKIIGNAEKILRSWGFTGNEINFSN